ncbi:MAG: HNH endonuclease [Myxococcales bacterium]|nr:HNH endonuclease [Myxococcales bacterium]
MTDEHCAYCDHFPLGIEASAEIDHFQPKSDDRFAHLAYEWTNLYGVCRRCNQAKSDRWEAALLRPDDEDYAFDRYFEVDLLTGRLEPRGDAPQADRERARVTIEVFGLNLHPRPRERARIAREPIEDGPYRYLFA